MPGKPSKQSKPLDAGQYRAAHYRLGIVTATVDRKRAEPCLQSWQQHASEKLPVTVVVNDSGYLGSVKAFHRGFDKHFKTYVDADVIACLHDDLVIFEQHWNEQVLDFFQEHPAAGLVGFGGWKALGQSDLYQRAYTPEQLEPLDFVSALTDAERLGARILAPERVVAVAGFALLGRRAFWSGFTAAEWRTRQTRRKVFPRPWAVLDDLHFHHHFADAALGCLARRAGWEVWVLPVRGRHLGGQTTGHVSYQQWAATQSDGGDRGLREAAYRLGYDKFKDVLPLRL
jgi:hypothetical protein